MNVELTWLTIKYHLGIGTGTLNKKSLNGQGKSMVTVLRRKFLVQWWNLYDFTATVFSCVIPYQLDTLQLTEEKEKKLSCSVFYWVIQKKFLECVVIVVDCDQIIRQDSMVLLYYGKASISIESALHGASLFLPVINMIDSPLQHTWDHSIWRNRLYTLPVEDDIVNPGCLTHDTYQNFILTCKSGILTSIILFAWV